MAINPNELMKKIQEEDKASVESLEKKIDDHLVRNFDGSQITYTAEQMSQRVRDEIIRRYRVAGWIVSYHPAMDQRDDNYLTFAQRGPQGGMSQP